MGMLSTRKEPPAASKLRRFEVTKWAHDQALHYLARPSEYRLDTTVRYQLTQVVQGYTGAMRLRPGKALSGCAIGIAGKGKHRDSEIRKRDTRAAPPSEIDPSAGPYCGLPWITSR
jgi:hypothetical protein